MFKRWEPERKTVARGSDPKLAAVQAELANDRGEVPQAEEYKWTKVHSLDGRKADVRSLIASAESRMVEKSRPKSILSRNLSLAAFFRRLFAPKQKQRDYSLEFDPKTGGSRRVYIVSDGGRR